MRPFAATIGALFAGCMAQANAACAPSSSDMTVIKFGYSVQNLLLSYYESVPVNESFVSTLPENVTSGTNVLGNAMGLKRQAQLGINALEQLASKAPMHIQMPKCEYNPPEPKNAMAHLMNAQHMESTLCGTFIGLADYVQCPEVSFLMARLAAGHSNHAVYMGSLMMEQLYMKNSTDLLPAFKPEEVMTPGMGVGHLGQWMKKCTDIPSVPCGGKLSIGPLTSNLTGTNGSMSSTSPSMFPTYTGAASTIQGGLEGILGVVIGAALF